ncbi:hypothetical protein U27_02903 [Candidatus Vecturithrix granuli]|uniref:Uncharacterized protein n=1 Tax=Vecturithrix granuli TaxID=1499967 RepID=A0A081BUD7_VECG1|nr:hypothetical protein U27_02903 [Candidatus Vecturithrix granuli]
MDVHEHGNVRLYKVVAILLRVLEQILSFRIYLFDSFAVNLKRRGGVNRKNCLSERENYVSPL